VKRAVLLGLSVLSLIGCGGSGASKQSADQTGSVPVKTVQIPSRTITYDVPSSSMEPTLHCAQPAVGCEAVMGDGAVVQEPVRDPKRGDIVLFRTPHLAAQECGSEGKFIKRVIGLPGDEWEERSGYVYINGKKLNESYVEADRRDSQTLSLKDIPPMNTYKQIPPGNYLMMGDNRSSSCDSRRWGLVPHRNLIGKIVQILRPATG
jgi:signal peptidase I